MGERAGALLEFIAFQAFSFPGSLVPFALPAEMSWLLAHARDEMLNDITLYFTGSGRRPILGTGFRACRNGS
jgi:hypothetical protein